MKNSFICNNKRLLISLHLEQVFNEMIFNNNNSIVDTWDEDRENNTKGFFLNTLTFQTLRYIMKEINNISKNSMNEINQVFFDFKYIHHIQSNMCEELRKIKCYLLEMRKDVVFFNVTESVYNDISKCFEKKEYSRKNEFTDQLSRLVFTNLGQDVTLSNRECSNISGELIDKKVISILENCCENKEQALSSTPIIINRFINIKNVIEKSSDMKRIIYNLAEKIMNEYNIQEKSDLLLFCHNLNGSYIAAALSKILLLDLLFIDHLGPIDKLHRVNLEKKIVPHKKYLIVTDIICGGSEVRAAKAIINFADGYYLGNLSIVKFNTINNERDKDIALLEVTKENNPLHIKLWTELK